MEVWGLTVDVERWPTILPTVDTVTLLDTGPLRTGVRALIVQPGLRAEWTVRTVEPDHRFVWTTQWHGKPMVAEHIVESVDGGALNTLRLSYDGNRRSLLTVLLGPLMRMTLAREAKAFRRAAESAHQRLQLFEGLHR